MRTKRTAAIVVVLSLGAACGGADDAREGVSPSTEGPTTTAVATSSSSGPEAASGPTTTATTPPPPSSGTAPKAPAPTTTTAASGPPTAPHATVFVAAAPADPAELDRLADQIAADETALRDAATPAADLPRLARRQQAAYRALSARPAALDRVLARLPEPLRPIARANVDAGAELRAMVTPKTSLPPWRIIPPPPPDELTGYYREAEARFGVPWAYLASVHLVETRMGRIRGTSTAGAQGPMQFLPSTWKAYGMGGDINDPRDAIFGAANYLKANGGASGRMDNALFHYNRSNRYVRAVTLYARQIEADLRAYLAYHAWQVYYITPWGDLWLEEGYGG